MVLWVLWRVVVELQHGFEVVGAAELESADSLYHRKGLAMVVMTVCSRTVCGAAGEYLDMQISICFDLPLNLVKHNVIANERATSSDQCISMCYVTAMQRWCEVVDCNCAVLSDSDCELLGLSDCHDG